MLAIQFKTLRELDSGLPVRLGPTRYGPSKAFPEINVRISEDLRRSVAFLGVEDDTPDGAGIRCLGTGFLVAYDQCRYLVTVKHVALGIADAPFRIRLNRKDGGSDNVDIDVGDVRWFSHPDPDVDLTVIPFQFDLKAAGYDVLYLAGIEERPPGVLGYDCGDLTYTIGLFRLLSGKKRNLPVVHSGNIALLPSDEKIPVQDWEDARRTRHIEGYLVQSESIEGLSGAPCFARQDIEITDVPTKQGDTAVLIPRKNVGFLGIWQGAWDARADEARIASVGRELRVPVGMGIVVPAYRLMEIFDMAELKEDRESLKKLWKLRDAASLDSVPVSQVDDANPNHLEDFTRLVDVAARKLPRGDQT